MGLFNNLMSKIFGQGASGAQTATASAPASGATSAQANAAPAAAPIAGVAPSATAQRGSAPQAQVDSQPVDVAANLDAMAAKNPEKLDWKRSIVDLMKLVGMDSSLSARKELAKELNYTGDTSDSAAMNIWLHKQVLRKLSENGGKVPQELLS